LKSYQYEKIGIIDSLRNNRIVNPFVFNSDEVDESKTILNENAGGDENKMQIDPQSNNNVSNLADKQVSYFKTVLYANKLKKDYLDNHFINKCI